MEHRRLHSVPGRPADQHRREPRTPPEPLWREALGQQLRTLRQQRRETLVETAERAGVSPQYLSEVERGRKEPSSEMIAALAGSLGTTLGDLTELVAEGLRAGRRAASHQRPATNSAPTLLASAA